MKKIYKSLVALTLIAAILASFCIPAFATELKTSIGIVHANGLRLRAKPNTDASILNMAYHDDNVVVIRQVGDWYLVNYNLDIGYMYGEYLEIKERENVDLGYGSIDPAVCNMRSGPSTSTEIVEQLDCGEEVFIFGFNCGWYKVKYDGEIGYIRSDLVTLLEKPYGNSGTVGGYYDDDDDDDYDYDDDDDDYSYDDDDDDYDYSYDDDDDYDYDDDDDDDDDDYSYSDTSLGEQIVSYAKGFLGYPYVYGGNGPDCFDCSGFVKYIYNHFGYSITRTATDQYESDGYYVSKGNLQPGDLIFFSAGDYMGHVGMYIGGNQFIHAANPSKGVCITDMDEYWYAVRYAGAKRII